MKKKWNARSTICMSQENSYELGLLVSKSLEGVDRRSYKCTYTIARVALANFLANLQIGDLYTFGRRFASPCPCPSGKGKDKANATRERRFDGHALRARPSHLCKKICTRNAIANLIAKRSFALAFVRHALARRAWAWIANRRFACQRTCLGLSKFYWSSQKFLVFVSATHKKTLPFGITEEDCVDVQGEALHTEGDLLQPLRWKECLQWYFAFALTEGRTSALLTNRRFVRPCTNKSKICTKPSLRKNDASGGNPDRSGFHPDASSFRLVDQPKADVFPRVKRIHHCCRLQLHLRCQEDLYADALINHNGAMKPGPFLGKKKSVLEIVQQIKDTICKKQLIECSTSVIVSISGGQDSIFLLFCLSFLQSKIDFTFKMLWCNHFWQTDSFYTTLHLTMCAVNFQKILITFLPLFVFDSDLLVFCNTPSLPTVTPSYVGLQVQSKALQDDLYTFLQNGLQSGTDGHALAIAPSVTRRFARKDNDDISKRSPKMFAKAATSESLARHWRHLTTERSCTFYTLDKAIYGHTLSDRVETIMFNLIRGAGNTGIQSLFWKRKFSTFFYNWFFLSFQHVFHNTHFSTSVTQYPRPYKFKIMVMHQR